MCTRLVSQKLSRTIVSTGRESRKTGVHGNERKTLGCAWKRLSLEISFSSDLSIVQTLSVTRFVRRILNSFSFSSREREREDGERLVRWIRQARHLSPRALNALLSITLLNAHLRIRNCAVLVKVLRSLLYFCYSITSLVEGTVPPKGPCFNQANYMMPL